ncbi:MAG: hypothetical protein OXU79_12830 [Gemmatimonadota bacterium]|nr:hypothetical protein [Gemmatimonadota bacterium]
MKKRESSGEKFDCVKWTREVRDRINAELAGMTPEERRLRLNAAVDKDPYFARIPKSRVVRPWQDDGASDGGRSGAEGD